MWSIVVTISLEMHMDVAPEMIIYVDMVKPNQYRLGPTLSVERSRNTVLLTSTQAAI